MIEQPQTTAVATRIIDNSALAKDEKEHLIDEEIILVKQDAITSSIRKTIRHLHNVGGFTARWRGLAISLVYHLAHSVSVNLFCSIFTPSALVQGAAYIVSSVMLSRVHMTWTHIMISNPSPKPWFRRFNADKKVAIESWKALALPSAVFATAQMLTIGLPFLVFVIFTSGPTDVQQQLMGLAAGGLCMLLLSLSILLPASVTLTRIEASFLPDDEDTIVPFDRTLNGARTADITLDGEDSAPSTPRKSLFVEAWRSFDKPSRLRLVKFYIKMALVQLMIVVVGVHVVMAEIYMLGIDRLSILAQSGSAQLQLAAMGVDAE